MSGAGKPSADYAPATIGAVGLSGSLDGFGLAFAPGPAISPDTTTDDYAHDQASTNVRKSLEYLRPILDRVGARAVLDVGCGVGVMVRTLLEHGYDAYGTDFPALVRFWRQAQMPTDRMFCVDAGMFRLPFADGAFDLVYTLGVIEHVGTTDGHADRRADCHRVRQDWLREVFRVVRPGGYALIGGPNRGFPVDVAHGSDSRAAWWERTLSSLAGATVHRVWGENFLWSYRDVDRYLSEIDHETQALSVSGYLGFSRVPAIVRPLAEAYVRHLPRRLLATGFNPWMMALVRKPDEDRQ